MSGNFAVNITANKDPKQCKISATGMQKHIITDIERAAFQLTDSRLKSIIGQLRGKVPDTVWLHDPTDPQGNRYAQYGWQELTTTLSVRNSYCLGVSTDQVIVSHVEWENNTDHSVHYHTSMSAQKSETTSFSWTNSNTITIGESVSCNIGVEGIGDIGGEASWSYEHAWSDTKEESRTITVGTESSADSDVPAHSKETAYLYSNLGTAKYRVEYIVSLSGWIAYQYIDWYEGHRYYAYEVNYLLGKMGIPSNILITLDMNVGFYSDAIVKVQPGTYDSYHKVSPEVMGYLIKGENDSQ